MSGNPLRGQVPLPPVLVDGFAAGGTILLDWNALCIVEQDLGAKIDRVASAMLGSAVMMRAIMRAALLEHHPKTDHATAGHVLQALGYTRAADLLMEALKLSFPEVAEAGDADPQGTAGDGTSPSASPSGASSDTAPPTSGAKLPEPSA